MEGADRINHTFGSSGGAHQLGVFVGGDAVLAALAVVSDVHPAPQTGFADPEVRGDHRDRVPSGFVRVDETEVDGEFGTVRVTEVFGCQSGRAPDLDPADFEPSEINLVVEDGEWRINEFVSKY